MRDKPGIDLDMCCSLDSNLRLDQPYVAVRLFGRLSSGESLFDQRRRSLIRTVTSQVLGSDGTPASQLRLTNGATQMKMRVCLMASALCATLAVIPPSASADSFIFSTGNPDGLMGTATRPDSPGKIEIESADDFVLTSPTSLTSATFTGLIPLGLPLSEISEVRVEIYRVFPNDSDVNRTSGPPTFSTSQVPTRVNSPSDVAFAERDSAAVGGLTFAPGIIGASFTVNNSVLNGIHPLPNVRTGGDGAATGQEVAFNVLFTSPIVLPTDHYFFIPQVQLTSGDFLWLSAARPIVAPGTPFPPGFTDLQSWVRNENLAPDWLRIGQDIVGGSPFPTFNATFTLSGQTVPEPGSLALMGIAVICFLVAAAGGGDKGRFYISL